MSHPHDIRQLSEELASDAGAPGSGNDIKK